MIRSEDTLLKTDDVLSRVQVSRATLYRLVERNEFPRPRNIGSGRAVRWFESDIDNWMAGLRDASRSEGGAA